MREQPFELNGTWDLYKFSVHEPKAGERVEVALHHGTSESPGITTICAGAYRSGDKTFLLDGFNGGVIKTWEQVSGWRPELPKWRVPTRLDSADQVPVLRIHKLHPDAVDPIQAHQGDAGYDLTAIDDGTFKDGFLEYRTGLAIELPPGFHALIHPRGSISKYDLVLCNSIGLVDNTFRGEWLCRFKIVVPVAILTRTMGPVATYIPSTPVRLYKKGDRIAQLVLARTEKFEMQSGEVGTDTDRGTGAFGSTGGCLGR